MKYFEITRSTGRKEIKKGRSIASIKRGMSLWDKQTANIEEAGKQTHTIRRKRK